MPGGEAAGELRQHVGGAVGRPERLGVGVGPVEGGHLIEVAAKARKRGLMGE